MCRDSLLFMDLLLVVQVPKQKGYVVGDISITGKGNIHFGSMLADYIQIKLVGLACNINDSNIKPVGS